MSDLGSTPSGRAGARPAAKQLPREPAGESVWLPWLQGGLLVLGSMIFGGALMIWVEIGESPASQTAERVSVVVEEQVASVPSKGRVALVQPLPGRPDLAVPASMFRGMRPVGESPSAVVSRVLDLGETASDPARERKVAALTPEHAAAAHGHHAHARAPIEISFRTPADEVPGYDPPRVGRMPDDALIAIVIDDLGHNRREVRRAMDLDAALTLAFLPYPQNADRLAEAAYRAGHELLVHLPMEPHDPQEDPGPNALRVGMNADELARRIEHNLTRFDGYVGVNNHMGSRFTSDHGSMALALGELNRRGLFFLDSVTGAGSQAKEIASSMAMPFARRDVFLDTVASVDFTKRQLARLERVAAERGTAIAIGHPYETTYQALAEWLPEARARGVTVVPLSQVVERVCDCVAVARQISRGFEE